MSHGLTDYDVPDNAITNAKLRNSAALSVIGRSANTSGDPEDIAATPRTGEVLGVLYGPIVDFGYPSSSGPETYKYNPDREPEFGLHAACSDNFLGNAEQLSWRWANQGSSTLTSEMDSELLIPEVTATESMRCRWIDAPTAGLSFCMTAKMAVVRYAATNFGGIQTLNTGTEGTPTELDRLIVVAGANHSVVRDTAASYTAGGTGTTNLIVTGFNIGFPHGPYYLQWRYIASSKSLAGYVSTDGMTWRITAFRTISAHPISIGWHANTTHASLAPSVRIHWVRTFTEGVNGATYDQYLNGQCGW